MAEPLKDQFTADVVERIAGDLAAAAEAAGRPFDRRRFRDVALDAFDDLELGARAQRVADAMAVSLPADQLAAIDIVRRSLGPDLDDSGESGMEPFRYWPHVKWIAVHGQGHLDEALALQYELTKRFTAEFSIRAYLVGPHRDVTLARLREWTADPNEHVRRLVSEGTRPRLPWAPRLSGFVDDPTPVVELLELLRDDPSEYVRRSVANNLNDVAKDHPALVVDICRRWWPDADADGRRMIRHALRTLIKAGDLGALDVLGFGPSSPVRVAGGRAEPATVTIGESVRVSIDLENPGPDSGRALVDIRLHFVKANGSTGPKVFKGAEVELGPGDATTISKKISLRQHSTRTHHPGRHAVDAIVNGTTVPIADFDLRPADP